MHSGAQRSGRGIVAGALIGSYVWLAFAACEYAFWLLAPRLLSSYCSDASLDPLAHLPLFGAYPLTGAAVGVAAAAIVGSGGGGDRLPAGRESALVCILALFGLALATSAGVAVQIEARGIGRAMALAPLAFALGLLMLGFAAWRGRRIGAAANPWLVSALLVGVPWGATLPGAGMDARIPVYGIALLYLAAAAWTALRAARGKAAGAEVRTAGSAASPVRVLLRAAAVAIGVVVVAVAFDSPAAGPATASERSAAAGAQPNVILIVLDTARAQNFSLYGYPRNTTPNIARFARDATVYTRAISASNYTLSSHASLFTGLLPTSHGAHPADPARRREGGGGERGLDGRFATLAELLGERGYFTAASIANYLFLSQGYNLDQGFERFAILSYRCAAPSPRPLLRRGLALIGGRTLQPGTSTPYHNAEQVNDDVFDVVDQLDRRAQRFFLFINYMDLHFPYAPPAPFDTMFPGRSLDFDRESYFSLRGAVLRGERTVTDSERLALLAGYDGAMAYLDSEVGRLFGELKRRGLYDDSLIVITSDHGEAFGEKGYLEHGTSTYQDQVHIPLIIKYPGNEGARIDAFVSSIDVVPTVLGVVGVTPPAEVQGRDLASMEPGPRLVISESFPRETFQHYGPRFRRVERAIVKDPFKLIESARGGPELYDLSADPHETRNLYDPDRAEARELLSSLNAWLAASAPPEGGAPVDDPETRERLRSLGYVR